MQESLNTSIVRIRTVDGRVVGAGFLVGERQILTCAHVVSQALGLADYPLDPPQERVSLDFPLIPPRALYTARIILWYPLLPDGSGDIAGLELQQEPPSEAQAARFAPIEDEWEHPFRTFGFPPGYDDGVWATGHLLGRQATDWVMIEDLKAQGFAVGPGFSGAPVWDTRVQSVVGMVVAASRPAETKAAFVIPLDVLRAAWPLMGEPRNPYKGLRAFTRDDAGDFFGREYMVKKLVDIVELLVIEQPATPGKRLLIIIGPSGSGKSSLVMAGLLPQLQRGALPASETWLYLGSMVPGKHPIEALGLTLATHFPDRSFTSIREDLEDDATRGLHRMTVHLLNLHQKNQPGARVVLLVDQFEELFTQTESEDERQRFIELLLTACSEPRGSLLVLLTMRADFYDRPMRYPDLFQLIDTQHLSLLSMEMNNLRKVIEQPAALPGVQLTFEGDLVDQLLAEIQGQVGALPLLQFTLDQLFQRRRGRQLTLSAYQEMGGVKGALSKHAEDTYATLPSDRHRELARSLFLRLIDPGMTEQDTTRRRAMLSELILDDPIQTRLLQETVDTFIVARLLTTNEIAGMITIEVSHEALIRVWKRLADWLREAREDIHLQQAISEDVAEWERRGMPRDRLYRGSQLKEASAWVKRNVPSRQEVAFFQASTRRRIQSALSVVIVVLLLLSTTGLASWFLLNPPADPTRVTTSKDNGVGSLRWAIVNATAGSTITFDTSLRKSVIFLTSNDLTFTNNMTIRGPGAQALAISGGKSGHIIHVLPHVTITLFGMSFINSISTNEYGYGFIENEGRLMISDSIISGNSAVLGGGIANVGGGKLTVVHSIVSGNRSKLGGGIYNEYELTLMNSTISGNTASDGNTVPDGGGIYTYGSQMTITSCTISGNTAYDGGGIYIEHGNLPVKVRNSTIAGNHAHIHPNVNVELPLSQ